MPRDFEFINLTPHDVTIVSEEGETLMVFPPSGEVTRVSEITEPIGYIGMCPVISKSYGDIEGLPAPQDKTWYIVSALTAQACPDRQDLLIPGNTVRDADGKIIGCTCLAKLG